MFFRLCRALSEREHAVRVLSGKGATEFLLGPSEMEHRINVPAVRIFGSLLLMFRLLFAGVREARRFDLIFVNAGYTVPIAVLVALATHRKVVELHHDVLGAGELVALASTPSRKVTAALRWALNYLPLRFVDGVAAVSAYTAERLRSVTGYRGAIEVIGNPIE